MTASEFIANKAKALKRKTRIVLAYVAAVILACTIPIKYFEEKPRPRPMNSPLRASIAILQVVQVDELA